MNLFLYSDESGVFDYIHNDYFLFGGLLFLSSIEKQDCSRLYSHAEKLAVQRSPGLNGRECKAAFLKPKVKGSLYRSLNRFLKFAILINLKRIPLEVYGSKRHKQRYMDYAYKIGIKRFFEYLIRQGRLNPDEIENIYVYNDEHHTATDGLYELKESLLAEFKYGTFNEDYGVYHKPLFPKMGSLDLKFLNSAKRGLIRAADIIANHFFYLYRHGRQKELIRAKGEENVFLYVLP